VTEDGRKREVRKGVALLGVLALSAATILASCTFLLPFDQVSDDAGAVLDATDEQPEEAAAAPSDAGHEAEASSVDNSKVCKHEDGGAPLNDGWYCANHNTSPYMGPPNDLIHCVNGAVAQIESCVHGCVFLSSAYSDECDECFGRASGNYCGRDLPDWPMRDPAVENLQVTCRGGQKQGDRSCNLDGGGCVSNEAGFVSSCP
jgi:hypothetical protein